MGQFDNGEQSSLSNVAPAATRDHALDGAAIMFNQNSLVRAANPLAENGIRLAQTTGPLFQQGQPGNFRDAIRNRLQGMPAGQYPAGDVGDQPLPIQQRPNNPLVPGVRDRVPTPVRDLPAMKFAPPTPSEPSLLEGANLKRTKLDTPYVSETSDQANKMFESLARIGSSAFFVNRDYLARTAALEKQIATTPLVSLGTTQKFSFARDELLESLKTPIQSAELKMEGLFKSYPLELFQGSSIPKLNGHGKILTPHPWDLDKLTAADQVVAERYLRLTSLREQLVGNWPPVPSTTLGRVPANVAASDLIQAEKLGVEAAKFDAAGVAFTSEVSTTLAANNAMRIAKNNMAFKSIGTLGAAWLTNAGTDILLETKHGPSAFTWGVDMISPAVLLTNRGMLTKFGVVAGAHLVARLYDKWNEKE